MATDSLEEIMERMRRWPKRRQEDAAEVLREMEQQDASEYRLTDAQVSEVIRVQQNLRNGTARLATDEEMAELWRACGL